MNDNRKFDNAQSQKLDSLEYYDMICEIESIMVYLIMDGKLEKIKEEKRTIMN